jgi:IclR family transcriptional regulator, KDG regulon repressor
MSKPSTIRAVSLAVDSIELLCKHAGGLGVRELARELEVGKSTGHRILRTLEEKGLARQDPQTERYIITVRLIEMASLIQNNLEVRHVARPSLTALQKRCGETIFMGVLDSEAVVIVDRIDSSESLRMTQDIGFREPAHSTAMGKVLLANLPEPELAAFCRTANLKGFTPKTLTSLDLLRSELKRVRLLGFALDDEETLTGVRCVAAPVRNGLGRAIAAVSLSGPSVRLLPERISDLAQDVRATAESVSRDLGFKGPQSTLESEAKNTERSGASGRLMEVHTLGSNRGKGTRPTRKGIREHSRSEAVPAGEVSRAKST